MITSEAAPGERRIEPALWPEICLNLWCFVDEPSGYIYLISGRAYALTGTKAQKLAMLRQLAVTDYCLADAVPVPQGFRVQFADGVMEGLLDPKDLVSVHQALFKPLLRTLRKKRAVFHPGGGNNIKVPNLTIPEVPLCLTTCLAVHEDARLEVLQIRE